MKHLPFAFTEQGAGMLACVLNSPADVTARMHVVREFVRLSEIIVERDGLGRKIAGLEISPVRGGGHPSTRKIDRCGRNH